MDIKGKVHEISPVQNVTETFKKRELVVEYAEKTPSTQNISNLKLYKIK